MYPYPMYYSGMQFPTMWSPMPPAFYPMPFQFNQPGFGAEGFGFYPPPPPDFSGFYPG